MKTLAVVWAASVVGLAADSVFERRQSHSTSEFSSVWRDCMALDSTYLRLANRLR